MLVQKTIKETEKDHKHIDIYFDGTYIGYIMKNQSGNAARVGENWNFTSKHILLKSTYDKTKKDLLSKIDISCRENKL